MIYDTIDRALPVAALNPRFASALAWLRESAGSAPIGRNEIDGDDVFVNINAYDTHPFDPDKFELHRTYVDIQFMIDGEEEIWVGGPDAMKGVVPYNAGKDVAWYRQAARDGLHRVVMKPGSFLLLWPDVEAHQPGVVLGATPAPVRKAIAKIRL